MHTTRRLPNARLTYDAASSRLVVEPARASEAAVVFPLLAGCWQLVKTRASLGQLSVSIAASRGGLLNRDEPRTQVLLTGAEPASCLLFARCIEEGRAPSAADIAAAYRARPTEAGAGPAISQRTAAPAGGYSAAHDLLRTWRPPAQAGIAAMARGGGFGAANSASGVASGSEGVQLSPEQSAIVHAVIGGTAGVFFTGSAGCGKSAVLAHLRRVLPASATAFTAPTGIAAVVLGGTTIHTWAGLSPGACAQIEAASAQRRLLPIASIVAQIRRSPDATRRWRTTRTLVVDEVSMVDGTLFDALDALGREVRGVDLPFGGLQVVLAGDFFQLPPVSKGREGLGGGVGGGVASSGSSAVYAFQSRAWAALCPTCFVLTRVFRQAGDASFAAILDEVRWGRVSATAAAAIGARYGAQLSHLPEGVVPTKLHTHRVRADAENAAALAALSGACMTYRAVDSFAGGVTASVTSARRLAANCPALLEVVLKVGAQVILNKTVDAAAGLVNGARGVVTGFEGGGGNAGYPLVRFLSLASNEHAPVAVRPETWELRLGSVLIATRRQVPLDLAWALSIHKAQGATLDAAELSLARVFECGQAYVALSRARSLDAITLSEPFSPSCVRAHPDVVTFYKSLSSGSNAEGSATRVPAPASASLPPATALFVAAPAQVSQASSAQLKKETRRTLAGTLQSYFAPPTATEHCVAVTAAVVSAATTALVPATDAPPLLAATGCAFVAPAPQLRAVSVRAAPAAGNVHVTIRSFFGGGRSACATAPPPAGGVGTDRAITTAAAHSSTSAGAAVPVIHSMHRSREQAFSSPTKSSAARARCLPVSPCGDAIEDAAAAISPCERSPAAKRDARLRASPGARASAVYTAGVDGRRLWGDAGL